MYKFTRAKYNAQSKMYRMLKISILIAVILSCGFSVSYSQIEEIDTSAIVTLRKNRVKVLPIVASSPETSIQLGAAAIRLFNFSKDTVKRFHRESSIALLAIYTFNRQFLTQAELTIYTGKGLKLFGKYNYSYYPDVYYGIGNEASVIFEYYTNSIFYFKGDILKTIDDKVLPGLVYEVRYDVIDDIAKGRSLDTNDVTGKEGGLLWEIGPVIVYDLRDNTFSPVKGHYFKVNINFSPNFLGNDYVNSWYGIDLRKYFPIGKKKNNVLASQFVMTVASGDVPFYKLGELGGERRLRGINENRYIDKAIICFQTELRAKIKGRFGFVLFGGTGASADRIDNFNSDNLKYSFGGGLRYTLIPDARLNVRIDYAYAKGKQ